MRASGRGVELSKNRSDHQEALVSHANAALTPRTRLKLAWLIVDHDWPVARAAERYDVSWPTAKRWADRYQELGEAGLVDRSSRPHQCPNRTPRSLRGAAGRREASGRERRSVEPPVRLVPQVIPSRPVALSTALAIQDVAVRDPPRSGHRQVVAR